jgi:hypothetical protein
MVIIESKRVQFLHDKQLVHCIRLLIFAMKITSNLHKIFRLLLLQNLARFGKEIALPRYK